MNRILYSLFFFLMLVSCAKQDAPSVQYDPVSHELWDQFLQIHVDTNGWVDYKQMKLSEDKLNEYLSELSSAHPNEKWNRTERMAYWINAYNAFTVKLILDHYPVESIRDIKNGIPFVNSVWDIEFINIQGVDYTLNDIEHKILRKEFGDPRIHFAINCASFSCPKLLDQAYKSEFLEAQLEVAAIEFINDPQRNIIKEDQVQISKIFSWFRGDFKNEQSKDIRVFLNKYSEIELSEDTEVDYLDYDWSLNEFNGQII